MLLSMYVKLCAYIYVNFFAKFNFLILLLSIVIVLRVSDQVPAVENNCLFPKNSQNIG